MLKAFCIVGIALSSLFSTYAKAEHVGVSVEIGGHYHAPYGGFYYAPYAYPAPVVYTQPVYVAPTPVYGEYYYHPYHHDHYYHY